MTKRTGEKIMKHLIEFPLQDGTTIIIEVESLESESGMIEAASPGEIVKKAKQTFENSLEKIQPALVSVVEKIRNLNFSQNPNEIEIQFGLRLTATSGAVIAVAGAEANFEVRLKWSQT